MTELGIIGHLTTNRALIMSLAGEVDFDNSSRLAAFIRDAITHGRITELIVDLDQVTFLDVSGVRALITGRHLAAQHGIGYHVINPHHIAQNPRHTRRAGNSHQKV